MSRTPMLPIAIALVVACEPARVPAQEAAASGGFDGLYDDATLRYWKARYEPNVLYNFRTLVLGKLTAEERARVGAVTLELPLRHDDDPLTFRADAPPPVITMSVASIKFLDDVAIAMSWLVEKGYSVETIAYYAAVLKYRSASELPNGRHAPPLAALGIPDDALADRKVDDASQKILKSAIVYILAHEMGHVLHGHRVDVSVEERQRQEAEADRSALDLYRRIGTPPLGTMATFFLWTHLGTHRGDFESEEAWRGHLRRSATHPMSSARLRAVAAQMRQQPDAYIHAEPRRDAALRAMAIVPSQLDSIATLLDDPDLAAHARVVGTRIPLQQLRPRRPGDIWIPPRSR